MHFYFALKVNPGPVCERGHHLNIAATRAAICKSFRLKTNTEILNKHCFMQNRNICYPVSCFNFKNEWSLSEILEGQDFWFYKLVLIYGNVTRWFNLELLLYGKNLFVYNQWKWETISTFLTLYTLFCKNLFHKNHEKFSKFWKPFRKISSKWKIGVIEI